MPLRVAFLDTGPLGLATQKKGHPEGDACRQWMDDLEKSGVVILVPEIADYELRRELVRSGNANALHRLDDFVDRQERLIPLQTPALRDATRLWAEAQNAGQPTAPPHALDGDVILAAQVLQFCVAQRISSPDVIVATVNVRHISRFVPSDEWQNIRANGDETTVE